MSYHFKYSLTEDDFAEFNAYTTWYAPWQKKSRFNYMLRFALYSILSYSATIIILRQLDVSAKSNFSFLISLSVVILILFGFFSFYQAPFSIKNKARKFINKEENKHILNETDLEITDDGIISSDKESQVQLKWGSITKYVVTKEYFYLYTNSVQAQVIPKKLFSSQQEINEFDKFLTEKIPLSSSFRSMRI